MYALAKNLLFRLDAEEAHEWVCERLEAVQAQPLLLAATRALFRGRIHSSPVEVWGLRFENRLGLAAGFDKNARLVPMLAALGFGFVEVGTVTLRPQPGNPRPRMFRYPEQRSLINRLGFNNEGADAVARRLDSLWHSPASQALPPLFVNIGKNKDVPESEAVNAYRRCYETLAPLADAVVVNVSSPNTPGLRNLQSAEHLRAIVSALCDARASIKPPRGGSHPIIVKIAPDLADEDIRETAHLVSQIADGLTATNTTIDHSSIRDRDEAGGLSGALLLERSTKVLRIAREAVGNEFPLIGVGGVMTGEDVARKLEAGATLVQAYTGFVYRGPRFAPAVLSEMEQLEEIRRGRGHPC